MLDASPEVDLIRRLVGKRLMDSRQLELGQRELDRMLLTLHRAGYVRLEPEPPGKDERASRRRPEPKKAAHGRWTWKPVSAATPPPAVPEVPPYRPVLAHPTPELAKLTLFRSVNPLYGVFLVEQLGIADRAERIQAMESVLELPGSVGRYVRVPKQDQLPPGPLATTRLDAQLLQLGLATAEELVMQPKEEEDRPRHTYDEDRVWVLALADKLRRLFDYELPGVGRPADAAGLGGRRVAGVRRRFQQVRHQQGPAKAGGHDLPPPAAADPAGGRVASSFPRRTWRPPSGRPTWRTSPRGSTESCRHVDPDQHRPGLGGGRGGGRKRAM